MQLSYYGHACFSVETGGKHILFDPFITGNELAKSVDINTIPADYIFISHGHFDHISDAVAIAQRTGAKVIGGWEVYQWIGKNGIKNAQPLNPGGKWQFDFGLVRCVAAVHSNSLPDGSYGGAASGFVVQAGESSFYYSGDTALTYDMKLIARYGKLDFAVLPIGDTLTMGIEDCIELAGWLGVKDIVGVHYDTFGVIKIDHAAAVKKFADNGLTLHLPGIGASIAVPERNDN